MLPTRGCGHHGAQLNHHGTQLNRRATRLGVTTVSEDRVITRASTEIRDLVEMAAYVIGLITRN